MSDYKLVCSTTVQGLNDQVNALLEQGYVLLGSHTHQKSIISNVDNVYTHPNDWVNAYCISMYKSS